MNNQRKRVFLGEIQPLIEEFILFDSSVDAQVRAEVRELVLDAIKRFVETFHISAQNVSFGKKANLLVSVVLRRIVIKYGLIETENEELKSLLDDKNNKNVLIQKIMTKYHLTNAIIDESITKILFQNSK